MCMQRLLNNFPDRPPCRGLGDHQGPVPQLEFRDGYQRTPLCCAARQNNVPLVQLVCIALRGNLQWSRVCLSWCSEASYAIAVMHCLTADGA